MRTACAAINCCVRERPDEPVRLSAGGSAGSAHSCPSKLFEECTGCSQNCEAIEAFTSRRDCLLSGVIGIAS